ncbi:PREDICTED: F-box/LRR-repeat protein 14-like [Nelumbo nucifera]|uniref:F-box/LRR-repeat protein 15-like leucin rich repeat domain-containing protein n=2 Tax=Nelumbo nucifera TaxID=4432 RepID=A0A822Y8E9_NELNU|nr:PREDICTED: F-box/LRR-repeat protein 14-like [Nelumbo nucifera]DAD27305.1 TPA_asm: hypothetical protein HUJ06_028773 [Nelumbo nucifera]
MEDLPDHLVWEILDRLKETVDRNSTSLACKRLHKFEREQREVLKVGLGLHPVNEALTSLCNRFTNLKKVEINYNDYWSELGKQMDDQGLLILSQYCPSLVDLTLSHCNSITDAGVRHLASCRKLVAFRLDYTSRITGRGLFFLVVGCKNIATLHLTRCSNVNSVEWLEYLGMLGTLEDLSIKNCKAIREGYLNKLGPGWQKLKRLQFEADFSSANVNDLDVWKGNWISCENLRELSLVNCIVSPGRGLSWLLDNCRALEKLYLHMCIGVRDSDIVNLTQKSNNLRSISLHLPSDFSRFFLNIPLRLTDESLKAIAHNCSMLESVKISYLDGDHFPSSFSSFNLSGILTLIQMCPVRVLILDHVSTFNDNGMEALCSAHFLQTLELVRCQAISDEGLQFVAQFPHLSFLMLVKCLVVTDDGLKPLVGSHKLERLTVEDCPQISERGVEGTARFVSYKQDLPSIY